MNDYERGKFYMEMQLAPERINLRNEILRLRNNWNELKKWLQANDIHYPEAIPFKETLRKMQELEDDK